MQLNYLSLFSGAGGGDLAFQHLLDGFRCVGYIDNEPYCQRVIRQRQKDGLLDEAPIFGDIRTFINSGCAELYRGVVQLITGGFPCQPFSVAGKQAGEDDPRNMWPETIHTIRMVRPRYAFLENVSGLLGSGYLPTIFSDLAEAGYNAKWTVLGTHHVGGLFKRDRLWILASTSTYRLEKCMQEISSRFKFNGWETDSLAFNRAKKVNGDGLLWPSDDRFWRLVDGQSNWVERIGANGNQQDSRVAATAWEILKP